MWDPTGCGGGGGGCFPTLPAYAPLTSPPDGARVPASTGNAVYLDWEPTTNWGSGCPNANTYRARWGLKVGPTCEMADITNSTGPLGDTTTFRIQPTTGAPYFTIGNTYCWTSQISNGTYAIHPSPWEITPIPNMTVTAGYGAPTKCGGVRASGRASFSNTNNPVTYVVDVSHPDNNFAGGLSYLDEVRVGFVPSTQLNTVTSPGSTAEPFFQNYAGFRVTGLNDSPGSIQFWAANTGSGNVWGDAKSSGNLTNASGTATLLGIGSQTTVSVLNNTTLRVTFTIRYENTFPNVPILNSFVMGLMEDNGVQYSPDYSVATRYVYRRYDTWRVDMSPPTVTVVGPAAAVAPNDFRITWTATDAATGDMGIATRTPTCTVTGGNIQIRQTTTPATDITLNDGVPAQCFFGATDGLKNYIYLVNNPYDAFNATYTATDGACNESTATTQTVQADPWTMVRYGSATAGGGFSYSIPDVDLSSFLSGFGNEAFASAFSTISGNSSMTSSRQSLAQTYTTNYDDLNTDPTQILGLSNWYDTFTNIINERYPGQVTDSNVNTMGINFNAFPVPSGTFFLRYNPPSGTLSTATGNAINFTCNRNAIVFVNGNMTITPNFVHSGTNRCIWIIRGNLTVNPGTNQNLVGGAAPTSLVYDQLAGAFIVDGTFTVAADPQQASPVNKYADGLQNPQAVVVAQNVSLLRDLGGTYNARQPSEMFIFDPRYIFEFSDELAVTKFSIRPK
ncbi:MAG: hypothetical protein JNK26_03825 [Candidatus Doudnabacteria bacterium]|nr:hypothetical protein [Candidatus Doudnabacteria bacterium]